MKILALSCGRKNGNSEILLKHALMEVQRVSCAEAELIRLHDLKIKACTGCESCVIGRFKGGNGDCVQKNDHFPFLLDKLEHCDAVLLGTPAYELMPPGLLILAINRMIGAGLRYRAQALEKPKVGAVITVGGSDWVNLVLPLTRYSLFQLCGRGVKLVDQMLVKYTASPGHVLLKEDALDRAKDLGNRVGRAMLLPLGDVEYEGPRDYTCPVCHSNLLQVRDGSVICPFCDIEGRVELTDGHIKVTFSEDEVQKRRYGPWGLQKHVREQKECKAEFNERKAEVAEKLGLYKKYLPCTRPPRLDAPPIGVAEA